MSNNAEIISSTALAWTYELCTVSLASFVFYDYLITFSSEVNLFWRIDVVGASALFLLNRYLTVLVQISQFLPCPPTFQGCVATSVAFAVLPDVQYLPWAAFSALRSYALSAQRYRWIISMTVFALSSVPTIINLLHFHWLSYVNDPTVGIELIDRVPVKLGRGFTIVTRTSLVVADAIVLGVTWYRTHEILKLSRVINKDSKESLSAILLRDGTVYFLVLLILNIVQILSSIILGDLSAIWGVVPSFTAPITAILTSRFLINLQRVKRRLIGPISRTSLSQGDLVFRPPARGSGVVESFGAQLSFDGDVECWDDCSS